jgi:hypothetical protein
LFEQGKGRLTGVGHMYLVSFRFQQKFQTVAESDFIVDDQDGVLYLHEGCYRTAGCRERCMMESKGQGFFRVPVDHTQSLKRVRD